MKSMQYADDVELYIRTVACLVTTYVYIYKIIQTRHKQCTCIIINERDKTNRLP